MIDFPLRIFKLNVGSLNLSVLKNYINENRCCKKYPTCTHPKEQSDPNVFKLKMINSFEKEYFNVLKNLFNNFTLIDNKAWVLHVKKNEKSPDIWHKHFDEKYQNFIQVSGLYYVTETDLGTEFENDLYKVEIKPKDKHLYIWESNLMHRPKTGIIKKDRFVLATNTVLKLNEKNKI